MKLFKVYFLLQESQFLAFQFNYAKWFKEKKKFLGLVYCNYPTKPERTGLLKKKTTTGHEFNSLHVTSSFHGKK
jgi:hypothetical protein